MSEGYEVTLPAGGSLEALAAASNLPPFGEVPCAFAAALSRVLTQTPAFRGFAELVSLGFWLRPAHVRRMAEEFARKHSGSVRLPRGLVFHVAPSNVDTIFVYSWMVSLLCGNRNLLRVSSRASEQAVSLLCALGTLLDDPAWAEVRQRTLIVRYGHDTAPSRRFSEAADVRVVWGGDATVARFRELPLRPHALELAFGDKFSLCVLDAASVLNAGADALVKLAGAFHNDAYWFGQMACSSPRLVLWVGPADAVQPARQRFWAAVGKELDRRALRADASDSMNKRVIADALAVEAAAPVHIDEHDPRITRVWLDDPAVHAQLHCGGGLFHEARLAELVQIVPLLSHRVQTISYFGIDPDAWRALLRRSPVRGADRVVPVGQALEFGPEWDGHDLFSSFTRCVDVR